jgi:hypothetical protein
MDKVHRWKAFSKCGARHGYDQVLIPFFWEWPHCGVLSYILYINSLRACVCPTRQFRVLIRRQNRPGQPDGRTDRFCMGEPAQTDGLCIISTNARWSVCLWAVSLSVTVGIKVDISVVLYVRDGARVSGGPGPALIWGRNFLFPVCGQSYWRKLG